MTDLTQVEMRAINGDVIIRDRPSVSGLDGGNIYEGNSIIVDLTTRTEAEDQIWVRHVRGWSPERRTDGSETYLLNGELDAFFIPGETHPQEPPVVEVPPVATPPVEEPPATTSKPEKPPQLEALVRVRVRDAPSLRGREKPGKSLTPGDIVGYDPDSRTTANGFIWVRHTTGWSAERSVSGDDVYLAEPNQQINTDVEETTNSGALIQRLPVDIDQTVFFQYFGNNVFAFTDGRDFNYDGYSQGLHGGLDFANRAKGIPVYAGLECEYVGVSRRSPNLTVRTKAGPYIFIYQHIINPRRFQPGDKIHPDTIIAEIEPQPWFHLHFEIRLREDMIINPLMLMSGNLINSITDKFDPETPLQGGPSRLKYFFVSDMWRKWTTPLDQPIIQRQGKLIGPRA